MRRIRFRGKILKGKGLINDGEWIEGGYYRDDCYGGCPEGKHYIIQWNSAYGGFTDLLEVDRKTVGEWTGVHDKNGKPIFEGDIVEIGNESPPYLQTIIFRDGCFETDDDCESINYILRFNDVIVRGNDSEHQATLYGVETLPQAPESTETA